MGKTENGAIWLDEKFLSPYDYWQFWRNVDDKDVLKFLKFFTDLKLNEIDNLKNNNINDLKIVLANRTTEMLHGEKKARDSENTAKEVFSNISTGSNLPIKIIKKKDLDEKINVINFISLANIDKSKSEIRRLIKSNGIKINDEIINDDKFQIDINGKLFVKNYIKLSIGKKKHFKIEIK